MEASAADDGDVMAVAAKILLSLRHKPLLHWPEWVPQPAPPEAAPEEEKEMPWPPPAWPKRRRSQQHAKAAKGKETGKVVVEVMRVLSPETPLEYHAAAGSGASTSGDEGYRSPAKRQQPPAASGDGGSGDEGCSSPAKRVRVEVAGDGGGSGNGREVVDTVKVAELKLLNQRCTTTSMATKEQQPLVQVLPSFVPPPAPAPSEHDMNGLLDLNVALDVPWREDC